MNVTVSIPDEFARSLEGRSDLSRQMLEAFAIENYRMQALSLGQVAELLDMSIDETHAFLKSHRVELDYTLDDLERDEQTVEMFLKK